MPLAGAVLVMVCIGWAGSGCPAAHCSTPPPPVKGAFGVASRWPAATLDCRVPGVIEGSDGFPPPHGLSGLSPETAPSAAFMELTSTSGPDGAVLVMVCVGWASFGVPRCSLFDAVPARQELLRRPFGMARHP